MDHVTMFSGGVGSWATARRVDHLPGDTHTLLVADTNTEAPDWRTFVDEAAATIDNAHLVILDNGGRDIWDVFDERRFIGNTRADVCSRILKREPLREWLDTNRDPETTVVYLGFDWTEEHRLDRARPHWHPWTIAAPLCDPPYRQKAELIDDANAAGLTTPALYTAGFPHNNCGGACVKAGQAQWKKLLDHDPERYAYHEQREQAFRDKVGADVAILRNRTRKDFAADTRPLTLEAFRERLEASPSLFDDGDWGDCKCLT